MFCVLATSAAVLGQPKFFWGVGFVSFGDVVKITAFGTF